MTEHEKYTWLHKQFLTGNDFYDKQELSQFLYNIECKLLRIKRISKLNKIIYE